MNETIGSIYVRLWNGESKYFVQESDERGFGDSIWNTEEDAAQHAKILLNNLIWKAENLKKIEEQKAKDLAAKIEREDLNGFADQETPMRRGLIIKTLNKQLNYKGQIITRRDLIRRLVKEGRIVENNDKLIDSNGCFLSDKVLTKIGIEYAQYLIFSGRMS